jgi:putative transposase
VYPVVWCPTRRRKVLVGPVRNRLEHVIGEVVAENGGEILRRALQPEHGHLFLRATPSTLPSASPRRSKGRRAPDSRAEFPQLKQVPALWTRSFFAATAGNGSQQTIQGYSERQRTR